MEGSSMRCDEAQPHNSNKFFVDVLVIILSESFRLSCSASRFYCSSENVKGYIRILLLFAVVLMGQLVLAEDRKL